MNAATDLPIIEAQNLLHSVMSRHPMLKKDIEKQFFLRMVKTPWVAMDWLEAFRDTRLKMAAFPLNVSSNDQEIKDAANAISGKVERLLASELKALKVLIKNHRHEERRTDADFCGPMPKAMALMIESRAIDLGETIAREHGVNWEHKVTDKTLNNRQQLAANLARLCDPKWWRKQLRTTQARQLETAARELAMTSSKRGGYVSFATIKRRGWQKGRNSELLESLVAINDSGQCYTLAELSELGVSNPANRRAELMTRINGFELWADDKVGLRPLFFTHTAPSRFHSHHRGGKQYSAWDYSTPRDAQAYLSSIWARVRAAWARADIEVFGFRVAEPHHDGCPHWHILLWIPKAQAQQAHDIYWAQALADEQGPPSEPALKRRLTLKVIDPVEAQRPKPDFCGPMRRQSATGYIAKYISKNIDGLKDDGESWSADSVNTAIRVEAWASTWGIRQFQQIGGPSVTVWRELRRLSEEQADCQEVEDLRAAADEGDWAGYVEQMGGAICPREERPLRAYMVSRKNEAGEILRNLYGEIVRAVEGLFAFDFLPVKTRLHTWAVKSIASLSSAQRECVLRGPPGRALDLCQ